MTLTRESLLLILICMVDLASTLYLLKTDGASEGNPSVSYTHLDVYKRQTTLLTAIVVRSMSGFHLLSAQTATL